uniref:Uncharacterized protein n=1 Tax=Ditylenchus dipsaci TaxID=166011 RepID=A0A915EFU4_9BILA
MLSAKQQLSGSNQPSRCSPSEERNESLKDAARSVSEYAEKSLATEVPSTNSRAVKRKIKSVGMDSGPMLAPMPLNMLRNLLLRNFHPLQTWLRRKQVKESAAGRSALRSQNVYLEIRFLLKFLFVEVSKCLMVDKLMPTLANGQLFLVPAGNDGLQTALPSAFDEMVSSSYSSKKVIIACSNELCTSCLAKMKLFLGAEFAKFERFYNEHVGHPEEDNDLKTALHAHGAAGFDLITSVEDIDPPISKLSGAHIHAQAAVNRLTENENSRRNIENPLCVDICLYWRV